MLNTKDNPGVKVPPPLVYVATFFLSILIEKFLPFSKSFFFTLPAHLIGFVFIVIGICISVPAVRQFIKSKNTLITVKAANNLQTTGIYTVSRNPMYSSLLVLYTGIAFLTGNWWTIMLLPVLFIIN
jgi:protein-S-isoprenylcysteine O-methyltransferase Ste14